MAKTKTKAKFAKKDAVKKRKVKARPEADHLVLGDGIWPMERDVLYRPDRLKYVRKLIKDEGCVFCKASSKKISFETLCVYQTKHSMVVLNKFPYNSGHLLILPKRHCGDMLLLSQEEWFDLCELQRTAMRIVGTEYEPGGFNLGINHGAVAGAGIPQHLHVHLIPRWSGDLNFFPLVAETKVVIETLEATYSRLKQAFDREVRGGSK